MDHQYDQISSFESSPPETVAVGEELIVLDTNDGLQVIKGDSRSSIKYSNEIIDITVAEYIIVLSTGSLTAYSIDGNPQWSKEIEDGVAVSASGENSVCGVLTKTELEIYNSKTGQQNEVRTRSQEGGMKDTVLSTPGLLVYQTWSFLTVTDELGKKKFELDLEAVIQDIGYFSNLILLSLQSDQIVAVDPDDGSICWKNEFYSPQIPRYGDNKMLVGSDNGIFSIDVNGKSTSVSNLPNGSVYMTKKGVVFVVKNGLISQHIYNNQQFDIKLINEAVGIEDTIELEVANPTDQTKSAALTLAVESCSLYSTDSSISIEPNESKKLSFQVKDIDVAGDSTVSIFVNDTLTEIASINLQNKTGGWQSIDDTLSIKKISEGNAYIEIKLKNNGKLPIDTAQLNEGDSPIKNISPGEEYSEIVRREYEPGRSISVGYRITRGDRQREFAPTCELPPEPTITTEIEEDALKAKIKSSTNIKFRDQLVVELPGAKRVRTDILLENGSYNLIVPKDEDGVARIALESLDIEELVTISGSDPLVAPKSDSNTNSKFSNGNYKDDKQNNNSSPNSVVQSRSEDKVHQSGELNKNNDSTDESKSKNDSNLSSPYGQPTEESSEVNESRQTNKEDLGNNKEADSVQQLQIERDTPDQIPAKGHVFLDRVRVTNKGSMLENIEIVSAGKRHKIDRMSESSSITLERFISISKKSSTTLPEIKVVDGSQELGATKKTKIDINTQGLSPGAVYDSSDNQFITQINNLDSKDYTINEISFGSKSNKERLDKTIDAEGEVSIQCEPPEELSSIQDNIPIWLNYEDKESNKKTIRFLAYNTDAEETSTESPSGDILETEIGSDTKVAGEYRSVVIEIFNSSNYAAEDISVNASGEAINDSFYTPAYQEELNPENEIHHYIDVDNSIPDPHFDVKLSYSIEGKERELEFHVEGPAIESEENWTDEHIKKWSINSIDTHDPDLPELPDIITTNFHQDTD